MIAAWAVIMAMGVVAAAPLWHDHSHGRGAVLGTGKGHVHADGSSCTHDHGASSKGAPADRQSPAPDDSDDCAICLAVHAPMGDGLPTLPLFEVSAAAGTVRLFGAERPSVEWVGRDRASRGPPPA